MLILYYCWQIYIDIKMNNIIKHINYEQFTQILGANSLDNFLKKTQGYACIFFIAEWSVPSRLTFKRIKKMYLNKKNIAFIDVDLVDNIQLCEKYKVTKVPHCIVIQNDKTQHEIIGLDIQKLNQALLKFNVVEEGNKKTPEICQRNHKLQKLQLLPYPPYIDNFFFCNRCKKVQKCEYNSPVLHCAECDYDLCKFCQIGD